MTKGNGKLKGEWPALLQRYVDEAGTQEYQPRRVRRRFHGLDTTLWQGYVHVDDVDQDAAIAYYTQTHGWELRADVPFGDEGGNRWVEVAPPGSATTLTEAQRASCACRMAASVTSIT